MAKAKEPQVTAAELIRNRILQLMAERKLTKTAMAERLGLTSRQAVSNFLGAGGDKDGANPSLGIIQRYAEAIGCTMADIIEPVLVAERTGRLAPITSNRGVYQRQPRAPRQQAAAPAA